MNFSVGMCCANQQVPNQGGMAAAHRHSLGYAGRCVWSMAVMRTRCAHVPSMGCMAIFCNLDHKY